MRVFVAGAAGALGSRLVALLIYRPATRLWSYPHAAKAGAISRAGAEAAVAGALNRAAVLQAVASAKPDVILHQMTSLGAANDLRRLDETFAGTNRLRTQGLDNLLAGARQAETRRIVVQSFCGWPYAREGGPVKSEEGPLDREPPPVAAIADGNR